jgi:hypothetical protein
MRSGARLGGWLVMHEDLKTTRRVRLLFDHFAVGKYTRSAFGYPNVAT